MEPRTDSIAPYNPIARVIWEGCIPIQLTLNAVEAKAHGIGEEMPLMIEAPRCSYLPFLTNHIRKHIKRLSTQLNIDDSEIWFDCQGAPLKWHYPIGLLYDIHGLQAASGAGKAPPLPWNITLHIANFPTDKLIKACSAESYQDYFMSMVKEADYLRNGSTKRIMNMSKADQTQLWDGLWTNRYDVFWGMNHRLVQNQDVVVRHLPIRIYLPENCPVVQEPVSPTDDHGHSRTLRQILSIALPDLFTEAEDADFQGSCRASVVIHGIEPSLDRSALWFAQNMAYPDNFLHLVVVLR